MLRLLCALGSVLLTPQIARAHRPGESSADFRWEHGRLEVKAVVSLQIATVVLDDPEVSIIGSYNFEQVRERLSERLSKTFVVEVSGQITRPSRTSVTLAPEGEIICVQIYPPMSRAALSVQASFLERLPDDSFCWLRVWRDAEHLQGQKLLTRGSPRADFPPSAPADEASSPDKKSSTNSSIPHDPSAGSGYEMRFLFEMGNMGDTRQTRRLFPAD